MGRDDPLLFALTQHDRACTITKQDDGAAIFRIKGACEDISPNHQSMLHRAIFDVLIGHAQCIGETCTGGSEVKRRAVFDLQHLLDHAGRTGEGMAGRGCGDNNQPNIVRFNACHFKGALRRTESHGGDGFVRRSNTTLADAGTGNNPLVRRLHHFFQIGIGADLAWQITARTDNFGIHLGFVTPG